MPNNSVLEVATGGHTEPPSDWMSAGRTRPFVFEDPVVVWLEFHGEEHGFEPDTSPYEFLKFIGEKGRQFESAWTERIAPSAVRVCGEAYEVRSVEKVQKTLSLIQDRVSVIAQAALWWAPERIYGVPDFLVHTSWLSENFRDLVSTSSTSSDHYVVFDAKFTTKLESPQKRKDHKNYTAQVRIYSYILGHLQGYMPEMGYLVARDQIVTPLTVPVTSTLNQPLDEDIASLRDQFVDIKLNGANYLPWRDEIVESNIKHQDDRWSTAKKTIACDKVPGKDPSLVYEISRAIKGELAVRGFSSLDSMLEIDPDRIPFEECRGLGPAKSKKIRAILEANQSECSLTPPSQLIPSQKDFEFYVDYDYFTNVNVDFATQWPGLEGCEMIFMIGIGWEEGGQYTHKTFIAGAEDQDEERTMFEAFLEFLQAKTGNGHTDNTKTALYHWSNPEVWQSRRVADRHGFADDHALRRLPWCDLQKVFLDGPCAVPGAWNFGLKEIAKALGTLSPEYDPEWPGDLDKGLQAMVMGWRMYEAADPTQTEEISILTEYLEADCRALWKVVKWLRSHKS